MWIGMWMLIDTHIFLWFVLGDPEITPAEIDKLSVAHREKRLFMSAISIWEIAMLHKGNKIALHQPLDLWIDRATQGIQILPITPDIALESVQLPNCVHKDPADRFILATARIHGLSLITRDEKLLDYMALGYA